MNYALVLKLMGNVFFYESLFMTISMGVSLLYGEREFICFLAVIIVAGVSGFFLSRIKPKNKVYLTRDAFAGVAISWIALSVVGAIPFFLSGKFGNFISCLFESISGFTTTGASILTEIESLPKGLLFWRSFTHWIGGMGVLVFILAVLPNMNASSINLMRAESPGPTPGKFVPKIKETAKILYIIYFSMTVLQVILLIIAGLPVYDAFINAFGSAGTGGFSNMNQSIGAYNNIAAEIIITVFMFLFGVNFSLYYLLLNKKIKDFFKDEELITYFGIVIAAIIIITINLSARFGFGDAIRYSSFQVSSIITTTGFATADFNTWPALSKAILTILMLTGCCAGSTGGGLKVIRLVTVFKALRNELGRLLHPKMVRVLKINGYKINDDITYRILLFFFIYALFFVVSFLLISIDNKDLVTSASAVIATMSNIGPGFELVGPAGNFAHFSGFSKIVLSCCMLAGRLEFMPFLILFIPSIWKRSYKEKNGVPE